MKNRNWTVVTPIERISMWTYRRPRAPDESKRIRRRSAHPPDDRTHLLHVFRGGAVGQVLCALDLVVVGRSLEEGRLEHTLVHGPRRFRLGCQVAQHEQVVLHERSAEVGRRASRYGGTRTNARWAADEKQNAEPSPIFAPIPGTHKRCKGAHKAP